MIGIQLLSSSLYGQLYQKGDTLYVNAFGIIDTTSYFNGSDGEGYSRMDIYELNGNHQ